MAIKRSKAKIVFDVCNHIFLFMLTVACIFPVIHILSISLSSVNAVETGKVTIFPIEFNLEAYKYVIGKAQFMTSLFITIKRTVIGVSINMLLTLLVAYQL